MDLRAVLGPQPRCSLVVSHIKHHRPCDVTSGGSSTHTHRLADVDSFVAPAGVGLGCSILGGCRWQPCSLIENPTAANEHHTSDSTSAELPLAGVKGPSQSNGDWDNTGTMRACTLCWDGLDARYQTLW